MAGGRIRKWLKQRIGLCEMRGCLDPGSKREFGGQSHGGLALCQFHRWAVYNNLVDLNACVAVQVCLPPECLKEMELLCAARGWRVGDA